ncbi:MAG: hydantoinase/oxoprolinase family protein [Chloroflexi bacterium]|nr:hydantoinase/oxoprolinase family protein [Chloroflexota bacterium]
MAQRLGVDTGGTFTDLALVDEATGAIRMYKLSSTPHDPSEAILGGITAILDENGVGAVDVAYLGHGTTVATNAVIEGRVARTGLITTRGFRDVIELARQRRPDLYNLEVDKPTPVVSRDLRREISERLDYEGNEISPVDEAEVRAILADFERAGVDSVAIALIHAYTNSAHEQQVKELVRRLLPTTSVCTSAEVLNEWREYERLSTTMLNAALLPVMGRYLRALERRVAEMAMPVGPHIMQSSGGIMGSEAAAERPVNTLFSGPSAGVIGAIHVARLADFENLITFDMGGTSTDVCLVENGAAATATQRDIGGFPVKAPTLDVHSVGAGGGSIGWIDQGGLLKVGPRSAGARPGPACYGLGGQEPAVTDANVTLGRLNPEHLLGGRMRIQSSLATEAIDGRIASQLGRSIPEAAAGIITIVNVNMIRAMRVISVERGHDPRQFTLVAFGGAGPVHACELAREFGISKVIVPEAPGILCALGLLVSDLRADFGRTYVARADEVDPAQITAIYADLEDQARRWLEREHVAPENAVLTRTTDVRYFGQDFELPVPTMAGEIEPAQLGEIIARFHREHERAYGYASPDALTQLVGFRVVATGSVARPQFTATGAGQSDVASAAIGSRPVYFDGAFVETPIYDRTRLRPGATLEGPAILDQMDSTTVVLPRQLVEVDGYRNLIITTN